MLKKLKSTKGFTIIEVLIVLAIAGLIILIVLLAIPALQRNQRNTSRKNDVSRIAGAVTNFTSNNNGTLPCQTAAVCQADLQGIYTDAGNLGQLSGLAVPANGVYNANTADQLARRAGANGALVPTCGATGRCDQVVVVTGAECAASGGATIAAGARSLAIQYTVETPGTAAYRGVCQNM